jgi:hypothetical protein
MGERLNVGARFPGAIAGLRLVGWLVSFIDDDSCSDRRGNLLGNLEGLGVDGWGITCGLNCWKTGTRLREIRAWEIWKTELCVMLVVAAIWVLRNG